MVIDKILNEALKFKKISLADDQANKDMEKTIGRMSFAIERSTISLNLGRMAGHTTAIIKNAKRSDIVFAQNKALADYVLREGGLTEAYSVGTNFAYWRGRRQTFRYVWVDNASFCVDRLPAVYEAVLASSDHTPIFILLG